LDEFIKHLGGKLLPRIFEESGFEPRQLFVLRHNHRFLEAFKIKIEQILPAGIIDHYADEYRDLIKKKRFTKLSEAQAMALEHLEAAYMIWLLSLIVPTAAFIGEWILKLKDFVVFLYVFVHQNSRKQSKKSRQRIAKHFEKI
jgi:hypothetical protein